jgi:hypothetical protein
MALFSGSGAAGMFRGIDRELVDRISKCTTDGTKINLRIDWLFVCFGAG